MRTCNKHPKWYDQPLRLSREERKDPMLAIDSFFDCYRLHEVRETLWNWMAELLSSDRSMMLEGSERSHVICFYERIESLVEATLLMKRRKDGKKRNPGQCYRKPE